MDAPTWHANKLTEAQAEALALLIEEAAEVQQAATKMLRHGLYGVYGDGTFNQDKLIQEVGDFVVAMQICCDQGLIDVLGLDTAVANKRERVGRFLHHVRVPPGKDQPVVEEDDSAGLKD